ncbi:hypothetical protein DFH11DRAFT_1635488, partial [Phellopilus nigrolimitatus]
MDRNKRRINQNKRRRNIAIPPRYRPSPLSASFFPGSFDLENTEEDEEELDSDRPITMIFSRRGTHIQFLVLSLTRTLYCLYVLLNDFLTSASIFFFKNLIVFSKCNLIFFTI